MGRVAKGTVRPTITKSPPREEVCTNCGRDIAKCGGTADQGNPNVLCGCPRVDDPRPENPELAAIVEWTLRPALARMAASPRRSAPSATASPSTHYTTNKQRPFVPPGKSRDWLLDNIKSMREYGAKKEGRDWVITIVGYDRWAAESGRGEVPSGSAGSRSRCRRAHHRRRHAREGGTATDDGGQVDASRTYGQRRVQERLLPGPPSDAGPEAPQAQVVPARPAAEGSPAGEGSRPHRAGLARPARVCALRARHRRDGVRRKRVAPDAGEAVAHVVDERPQQPAGTHPARVGDASDARRYAGARQGARAQARHRRPRWQDARPHRAQHLAHGHRTVR